jgi:oxygen-independent coproporphyrinogen-3 oxidase
MTDVGVYVHIPFCRKKCGYCDFYSVCGKAVTDEKIQEYVENIRYEYYILANQYSSTRILFNNPHQYRSLKSIFFGGGTPSLLSHSQIKEIIYATIRADYSVDTIPDTLLSSTEITFEANPDDLVKDDGDYVRGLKEVGVNRISVGVQSFDIGVLKTLDRTHNPDNVIKSVEYAKQNDMNISLDLIYGAPYETLESWENTVKRAIELDPNHISAYALTLDNEDGGGKTSMAVKIKRGELPPIDVDLQAEKYELTDKLLTDAGYLWYETSNWAKVSPTDDLGDFANTAKNRSLHNMLYWKGQDWLGLGPGAHSHLNIPKEYVSEDVPVEEFRFWDKPNLKNYSDSFEYNRKYSPVDDGGHLIGAITEFEDISREEGKLEKIMLESRLNQDLSKFLQISPKLLAHLKKDGLLDETNHPTVKGRLLGDELTRRIDADVFCDRYQTKRCMTCPQCIME